MKLDYISTRWAIRNDGAVVKLLRPGETKLDKIGN
jgi:hypothetical protein